jgi:hypothetical protein
MVTRSTWFADRAPRRISVIDAHVEHVERLADASLYLGTDQAQADAADQPRIDR